MNPHSQFHNYFIRARHTQFFSPLPFLQPVSHPNTHSQLFGVIESQYSSIFFKFFKESVQTQAFFEHQHPDF
jgi:hypothetical protein